MVILFSVCPWRFRLEFCTHMVSMSIWFRRSLGIGCPICHIASEHIVTFRTFTIGTISKMYFWSYPLTFISILRWIPWLMCVEIRTYMYLCLLACERKSIVCSQLFLIEHVIRPMCRVVSNFCLRIFVTLRSRGVQTVLLQFFLHPIHRCKHIGVNVNVLFTCCTHYAL